LEYLFAEDLSHNMWKQTSLLLLATLITTSGLAQSDWPHWRGPSHNGVSEETDLPTIWSTTENIYWKLDLPGRSGATPIIAGDRMFVNVTEGGQIGLWAVDRGTGEMLWTVDLGSGNERLMKGNRANPSPVTDGESLWVMSGHGLLRRFDMDGNEIWMRDIQEDHGAWGLLWGYGSSPVLYEDSLYVQVLHGFYTDDASYLLRIDKDSGRTLWRTERPTEAIRESPDSYTTPAIVETASGPELVVTGGDVVTGHALTTGEELWRLEGLNPRNARDYRIVASPVVEDDIVVAPTRVRPLTVLRAGGRGDVTESHRLWSTDFGPDVPTPVTDGTYLYVVRDNGVVHCFDLLTGEEIYGRQRLRSGTYSSSLVLADGNIYATSEDGITSVFKAGPEFEIISENDLDGYTLSSPAIVDGQIFIRTDFALWAIGEPR
jgi:outer membrane protein assembly factor BamB